MPTQQDDVEAGDIEAWLAKVQEDADRKSFFVFALLDPTFHWFFSQGQQALESELYIPGVSSILNGIEASLRVTMAQLEDEQLGRLSLSPYRLLSNTMLRKARDAGLPVELLALQGDQDLLTQIDTKTNVGIVQLRHDVCHGDILRFVQRVELEEIEFLTPECLRPTAARLLDVAYNWASGLAKFRAGSGLRPEGLSVPKVPRNPLAEWL
jgi:hypothetical protein